MLYQKIHTGEKPYSINIGGCSSFQEHRHADFELNFCVEGEFDILADKKLLHVEAGCTTLIPPMCAHEVPVQAQAEKRTVIIVMAGMSLLKEHFSDFSHTATEPRVFDLRAPEYARVRALFIECAEELREKRKNSELVITGNILKIFAYLFADSEKAASGERIAADYRKIENVEKALELIYYNYKEPLSVERVAMLTGYSKSNFCKIFKKVVGESFHQALNRRRAANAAGLLRATDISVADAAMEVGFSESKAFCRVFKSIYGITPGQYRRSEKGEET